MKIHSSIFILFMLVLACTSKNTTDLEVELDTYFSTIFTEGEPGASVVLLKNGEVSFSKNYGLADLDTKDPISSKTLFNLGSVSKTFVAYGILMLRDQGELSLEDPLSKYFPDFKNKAIAEKVTIRHLLTHTSGLPDKRKVKEDSVFYLTAKDEENWAPIMQTDSLLFEPGENYEYSNPAFNALALIIEKVSGSVWQEFIVEHIFKPSGMLTSTITNGPYPQSGVSHGYVKGDNQWIEKDYGEEPTFAAAGNGGVWSSIEELLLYAQAMERATFLSEETIAESKRIVTPSNWKGITQPFIGLSWFIEHTDDGVKMVSHTGTQGGFYCHYVSFPEEKILYIVLANREYPREDGLSKIMEVMLKRNRLAK
jgi:CubicO group peptidase (beta-lactamase class C family)